MTVTDNLIAGITAAVVSGTYNFIANRLLFKHIEKFERRILKKWQKKKSR